MVARVPSDGFVGWSLTCATTTTSSASLIKVSKTNYTAKNNTQVTYLRNLRREKTKKDLESMPPISDHSNPFITTTTTTTTMAILSDMGSSLPPWLSSPLNYSLHFFPQPPLIPNKKRCPPWPLTLIPIPWRLCPRWW